MLYPLDEVLLLSLCAVLCGAGGWVSVSIFGKAKLPFLRRFLPFENGIPSHDQLWAQGNTKKRHGHVK